VNDRPASKIVGVGRALGSRVVTNRDFETTLDTTEEWISSRTGISERRFVGEDEDCATLAIEASREALKHAGATGESVDLVVCATSTAPESAPSTWRQPVPVSPTRPPSPTPCSPASGRAGCS
jgi:3-oxoacyl-[acyl-carrier-protein] synthase III